MKRRLLFCGLLIMLLGAGSHAQMITGVWRGKINRHKAELKIIQKGDSLTGTSYYYESAKKYRRYSIKGYFDSNTNQTVWWDDVLLEDASGNASPLLSSADFNCPGGARMMLDGKAGKKGDENPQGIVDLDKVTSPTFNDEWDFVIENYTVGGNDPAIIDSIGLIAQHPATPPPVITISKPAEPVIAEKPVTKPAPIAKNGPPKVVPVIKPAVINPPVTAITIEEKLQKRTKIFTTEIPLVGDSIELKFYDNAEIDGDSISLFLNDRLIFQHVRLLASAYAIKFAIADLQDTNELVMVAENLGSIPPNTSYMVAMVDDKKYDARLVSTEGSSAMIRLVKPK